jgi:hypothetical protein
VSVVNLRTLGEAIVPSDHVTLIVGPNNVGKSAILAGIQQETSFEPHQQAATNEQPVATVTLAIPQGDDYVRSVIDRAKTFPPGVWPHGQFAEESFVFRTGVSITRSSLTSALTRANRLGQVSNTIMTMMGPEGRGGVLGAQSLPDLMNNAVRTPLQMLWEDRELEATIDGYMQRAFGKRLTVNRHAGLNVYLQIGKVATPEPRVGERTQYLDEVMRLPQLSMQGSGMQAFMGTILTLATGGYDFVLLDEPEVFLHPPQARLLGEVVAEMSRNGGPQVIVATHSDDFVQGVIGASRDDGDVTVVRITRPADDVNRVAQVNPEAIKSLYRDPLLRYSNIIDGIFYKGVVICEAESDCTYYSATLAHVEGEKKLGASDLLFTQCGGKDRFARAYKALAAASVPTAVIADIDLLADKGKFTELYEEMGGNFAAIEASYNTLESSVRSQKVDPERSAVRDELNALIDASDAATFTKAELGKIADITRSESGWRQLKRKGSGVIDSGGPTAAFESIIAACLAVGLFVVELGELERFHKNVIANKQEWLREVLEKELFKESPEAHSFVESVREFIASRQ